MQDDEFEWDDEKAEDNVLKHGVSFRVAAAVFEDVNAYVRHDAANSDDEERFVVTGVVGDLLLTVAYTERRERIRIISARRADNYERRTYYQS